MKPKLKFKMKFNTVHGLIFATFLLLASFGCKKDHEVQTIYISDSIKQYSVFPIGSYWVYQDTTSMIDSSYITQSATYSFSQNSSADPIYQNCNLEYGGSFLDFARINQGRYYIHYKPIHIYFSSIGPCCLIDAPSQWDKWYTLTPVESLYYNQELDTLRVNNIVYHNVLQTTFRYLYREQYALGATFYFVKAIGLIKIQEWSPSGLGNSWGLIRYKISD